jgi:hypothetical protein
MQDKVSVSFYAEALCPYCALATTSVVAPIFENGLANFTDFRYIPSGNAKNGSQVRTGRLIGDMHACGCAASL